MQPESEQASPLTEQQTALELRRMAGVAAVVLACGVLATLAPRVVPHADRVAPWIAGEGAPIARLFVEDAQASEKALPGFAEASVGAGSLDDQSAAKLAGEAAPTEAPRQPESLGEPASPASGIAPSEYEGIVQQIEGREHLGPFFKQLVRTFRREPKAITRVAHYGDSAVAADSITSTARRMLQARMGDAGHGFILIARGSMQHYMHRDIVHRSAGEWEVNSIVHAQLRDGRYGYGGVQARARGGASATFGTVEDGPIGTRASRLQLYYQRTRGGGGVQLRVDGETVRSVSTSGDAIEDAVETLDVPDGPHQFSLRMTGGVSKLYGVALERDVTGIVYDSLGLVGAVAERLLEMRPEHIAGQIELRDPHLLVLAFGGNESANAWLNLESYEKNLTGVVERMRSGKPDMPCLLFGPLDQAERDARGKVVTVPILPKIIDVQRRVATAQKCAFFDAYAAMGGEGAMARWLKVRPRLATSDMRHATPKGYEVIGTLYYKALLHAFAEHLGRTRK
jgi:lysophospholipase L1-like esterase